MYIMVKNKKIEIQELNTFKERFKSLKFYLEPLNFGIKIKNKKLASTYFFCQRVDICFTDKNNNIIALYENIKSEKRLLNIHAYNIYYLPLGTCKNLKDQDKLIVKEK